MANESVQPAYRNLAESIKRDVVDPAYEKEADHKKRGCE